MMGYTHAATGAAVALAYAMGTTDNSPETYLVATVAGALGGIAVDIDTKDQLTNPKVTDAGRSRIAVLGLIAIGALLAFLLKFNICQTIIKDPYSVLGGTIAFIVLMVIGHSTDHRTFTHSLLFTILTGACVIYVNEGAAEFYLVGCWLPLLLDMLNNPFRGHGVWLLYPKKGKGIALGWCKAARTGNKVFYFIGIILFAGLSAFYIWQLNSIEQSIAPAIIAVYMIIAMHFVRIKSEKEQRHIMHIKGEL